MYIYQESAYYFDDFRVEEEITKKLKIKDLDKAFIKVAAWIAVHKADDVFPEECCDDEVVNICTYLDDDIQYCVKILFTREEAGEDGNVPGD